MMYAELILAAAAVLLLISFLRQNASTPKRPPGPWGLPVIGNLLDIAVGGGPHLMLQNWAKKFGSIYSINLGSYCAIVVSDPKLVKELFSKGSASGRPKNPLYAAYSQNTGIINSDGPNWEVQRRFLIRTLKNLGVGKKSILEGRILEQVKGLLTLLENNLGNPIQGHDLFIPFLTATIGSLVTSERDEADIIEKKLLVEKANALMIAGDVMTASGLFFFPSLRFVAPGYFGWDGFIQALKDLHTAIDRRIAKHKSRLDPSNPMDYMDHFLLEMESASAPNSSFYKESGYNNLKSAIGDVFIAGSETSSKTLEWALIYLSQNIKVQREFQSELDQVIGKSRLPSVSDKAILPYTEALIYETLRLSSIALMGVPHRQFENTELQGYLIPKDSMVISNLYTIHHDASIWGDDVDEFRPERFLNEDKTEVIRHEALIPFASGKRQCPGESMGMDTLFLYLTCIFQRFNVDPDPDCLIADLSGQPGFTLGPKPFRIVVNLR